MTTTTKHELPARIHGTTTAEANYGTEFDPLYRPGEIRCDSATGTWSVHCELICGNGVPGFHLTASRRQKLAKLAWSLAVK